MSGADHKHLPSAPEPHMICMNCRHYDTVWLNCKFLGFDGIRENPNMRCNIEIVKDGAKAFAFEMCTPEQFEEEEDLRNQLRGDDPIDI